MDKNRINEEIIISLDKAMMTNEVDSMQDTIEHLIKITSNLIFIQEYENLHSLFQGGAKRIEAWGNRLNIEAHENYSRVFSYASFWIIKAVSEMLFHKYKLEDRAEEKYEEVKQLQKSKYFYPMMELLEENGELPQGAIARHLRVSTNALSNFLRRNEKYGLWDSAKYGKYNYYHLTSDGKQYLQLYQKKSIKENGSINQILIYFTNCLADEMDKEIPNTETIIDKMNKKFGNKQAVFGNDADKIAIRKMVRKISHRFRRRREEYYDIGTYDDMRRYIDLDENSYSFIENDPYLSMDFGGNS